MIWHVLHDWMGENDWMNENDWMRECAQMIEWMSDFGRDRHLQTIFLLKLAPLLSLAREKWTFPPKVNIPANPAYDVYIS